MRSPAPIGRWTNTAWNLFFHYSTIAFTVAQGVILVPLYLHYIPVNLYGAWLASGNIAMWFTLVDPGLAGVVQQRVAEAYGRGDLQEVGRLTVAGAWITGACACVVIGAGLACTPYVGRTLGLHDPAEIALVNRCFAISIVAAGVMLGAYLLGAVNLGLQAVRPSGIVNLLVMVTALALVVVLLRDGYGLVALPVAMLFRALFWLVGSAAITFQQFRARGVRVEARLCLPDKLGALFGLAFFDRALAALAANVDSLFVARLLGAEQVAVLNLTRRPFQIADNVLSRPALALMPAVAHAVGAGEIDRAGRALARVVTIFVWIAAPLVGGLCAFNGRFVRLWVGPELFGGTGLTLLLAASLICSVVVNSLSNLCWALGNVRGNCMVNIAQNAIVIAALFPALSWLGLPGVLVVPMIAMGCVSLWYYPRRFARLIALDRAEKRRLVREAAITSAVAAAWALVFYQLGDRGWADLVLHAAAYCVLFVLTLLLMSAEFRLQLSGVVRMRLRWPGS